MRRHDLTANSLPNSMFTHALHYLYLYRKRMRILFCVNGKKHNLYHPIRSAVAFVSEMELQAEQVFE